MRAGVVPVALRAELRHSSYDCKRTPKSSFDKKMATLWRIAVKELEQVSCLSQTHSCTFN